MENLVATPVGRPTGNGGNLPPLGKTRDKAAAFGGWSGRTYEKAKEIVEAAEEEPERFGPLVEEMDRTGRVNGVHKKLKVARIAGNKPEPKAPEASIDDKLHKVYQLMGELNHELAHVGSHLESEAFTLDFVKDDNKTKTFLIALYATGRALRRLMANTFPDKEEAAEEQHPRMSWAEMEAQNIETIESEVTN